MERHPYYIPYSTRQRNVPYVYLNEVTIFTFNLSELELTFHSYLEK